MFTTAGYRGAVARQDVLSYVICTWYPLLLIHCVNFKGFDTGFVSFCMYKFTSNYFWGTGAKNLVYLWDERIQLNILSVLLLLLKYMH